MGSTIREIIQKFRSEMLFKHNTDQLSSVTLSAEDTQPVTDLIEFLEVELDQGLDMEPVAEDVHLREQIGIVDLRSALPY